MPAGAAPDQDQADFRWLAEWLERRGLPASPRAWVERLRLALGAPGAEGAGAPTGEQLTLFPLPAARAARAARGGPEWDGPARVAPNWWARGVLFLLALGYIALFTYWSNRNHDGLATQAYDLGVFDQGVWLLSQFHRPLVTIHGRHLFGDHTSFILLPWALAYMVLPSAKVLLTSQAIALGLGAVPTFLIAREKLRNEWFAAVFGAVYLLHPVLGWTNLDHFHPDAFEIPLVLLAIWFMLKARWRPYFVCVVALLLIKEDVAFLTFGLGVYVALRHDRRVGIATCALSVLYCAASFAWVIPAFNAGGTVYTSRIPFGGPAGFLGRVFTNPGEVIEYVMTEKRLWYVWQLFLPVAFVAVLAPAVALIAFGPLALNLITSFPYQFEIRYHYSTLILPVLVAATIYGVATVVPARRKQVVGLVLAASLVGAYLWGPTPLGRTKAYVADPGSETVRSFRRAEKLVPKDAVVSTHYSWVPQLDHRREIYMFPNPWRASYWEDFTKEGQRLPQADSVQYIVLPSQLDADPAAVLAGIRHEFDTLYDSDGVVVLKRRGA